MATRPKPLHAAKTVAPLRAAFYLRVSTTQGQTVLNQRRELEQVAKRAGWQVVGVYEVTGISGAKGREARPSLDALLKGAGRRKFNLVAAWSVDRLGRSLQDLLSFLAELHALGCALYLHQQAVDTSTPAGRTLFQMLGIFAEFECFMIRNRVLAGLVHARAQGKRLGRPRVEGEGVERARSALESGASLRAPHKRAAFLWLLSGA